MNLATPKRSGQIYFLILSPSCETNENDFGGFDHRLNQQRRMHVLF